MKFTSTYFLFEVALKWTALTRDGSFSKASARPGAPSFPGLTLLSLFRCHTDQGCPPCAFDCGYPVRPAAARERPAPRAPLTPLRAAAICNSRRTSILPFLAPVRCPPS